MVYSLPERRGTHPPIDRLPGFREPRPVPRRHPRPIHRRPRPRAAGVCAGPRLTCPARLPPCTKPRTASGVSCPWPAPPWNCSGSGRGPAPGYRPGVSRTHPPGEARGPAHPVRDGPEARGHPGFSLARLAAHLRVLPRHERGEPGGNCRGPWSQDLEHGQKVRRT